MDYYNWLKAATMRLASSDSARRDAEILLSFVTAKDISFLIAFDERLLTAQQQKKLESLLVRREKGEPVAYLVGNREFWSLPLSVSPATMIPRADSECLVALALKRLPSAPCDILDLGTGTGAIALALASERSDCTITAIDVHLDALEIAQHNAHKLKISNVKFLHSNWFDSLTDSKYFWLIACNPPYIDAHDAHLMQGDVRFEPVRALVAAQNGLADLASIVRQAPKYLQGQGWLLLEHGWTQGSSVRALLWNAGFVAVSTYRDYGNNERVTLGQWTMLK